MKDFLKSTLMIAATAVLGIITANVDACTGIKLVAKDGSFVHGRTLEFGIQVEATVAVIPRNYDFIGTTPNGKGLAYKSKYAAVGTLPFNMPALMDGLNEKGLAVGTFYFPGFAGYSTITPANETKALSPVEFPNWILTQFATVEEVKAGLASIVISPTVVKAWGDTPAPFHYIVFDKQGNGLVIEPIDGKLLTYENPLGTFTNSPAFDWHMTNLRNFINLTPINAKPLTIAGMTLAPFGQGSGMVGLPGDFTPPSRFVRAAIFSVTAIPSPTAKEAVLQAFHILNQFDIPVGAARTVVNGVTYSDSTQITCVRDPQALQYYFKTYDDQTIKMVDLTKFDLNAKTIVQAPTTGLQPIFDITSQLK
ncbi:MAG: choloylglycine hydrolase family protein [Parachlamydiaceae bacterium]